MIFSTQKRIYLRFTLAALVLLAVGVISLHSLFKLTATAESAKHSQDVLTHLATTIAFIYEAESAQRGYAVTADSDFLARYDLAVRQVRDQLKHLKKIESESPHITRQLEKLEALLESRISFWDKRIELRRSQGFEAAQKAMAIGTGRKDQDQIHKIVEDIEGEENSILSGQEEETRNTVVVTAAAVIFGGLFAFAMVWLAIALAFRRTSELNNANRTLQLISECNQVLVHATNEQYLMDAICKLVVEHGGYRLSWIGFADPDSLKTIRILASAGIEKGYLEKLKITWDESIYGQGPAGTSIRTGKHVIINNTLEDLCFAPWRDAAVKHGFRSCVAMPLFSQGHVFGTFMLYKAEANAFNDSEVSLLLELAGDLAYGIDVLHTRAEKERIEESSKLRDKHIHFLSKYANDFIILLDENFNFLEINDRVCEIYGYSRDELIGMHASRLRAPDTKDDFISQIRQAQERGSALYETVHQGKDGHVFPVEINLHAIESEGKKYYQAILRDITERRRAAEEIEKYQKHLEEMVKQRTAELHSANEQLAAIFEAATSGIVLVKDRRIMQCNRKMDEIFGYPPGGMLGKSTRMWYLCESDYEIIGRETAECLSGGKIFFKEQKMIRKDGTVFWGRMSAQAADKEDRSKGLVGLIEDITIERENSEALKNALERAEAADRLKSAFLATMSHELRTPLNSIIGFTGIILQELAGPLNPEQRKQLEMVRNSARHLLALINDVLDISKIEAGQMEVRIEHFDLRASVEKVNGIVKPLVEKKGLALNQYIAPGVGSITSDPRRVEQILLNLINNAVKFTEKGSISLKVETLSMTGQRDKIRISVADTGIGIRQEDISKLFQPFRQIDSGLSRQHEGTGLGLAICRRLAEILGGEITVSSEYGRGSIFIFELPQKGPVKP